MKGKVLFVAWACLISGCLPKSAFAPPPQDYETWTKPGASELDVWKIMLECGYASPFAATGEFPGGYRSDEQIVEAMLCIERSGYRHHVERRATPVCSGWRARTSACQIGATVARPDPSIRLSSGYCKRYPQSRACLP